jgi:acetyltransferase-like isoleucine patch superfamily enzyme
MLKIIETTKHVIRWIINSFPSRDNFGYCAPNAQVFYPLTIDTPRNLFLYENTKIRDGIRIINSPKEKVIVGKYTTITPNVTIVTNNHVSTVGIPHVLLGSSHINDISKDIIIGEDCWVGTGAKLLAGTHLGRGCIVGAGSIVSKDVPPYALVVGSPAKIVAVKFSLEQILEHEKALYPEDERFSRSYLEELFAKYFEGKKVYGRSGDITEKEHNTLECVKKRIRYVEPY